MKYIFFGSPRFAAVVLERLIEHGFLPAVLVANPDRPVGRKKILTPPPTKTIVKEQAPEALVLQPEQLDDVFVSELHAFEPDLFIVAAYAKIIPASILAIPRLGTIGVHPSLLPKYRGASPIQSALLAGEKESGTTIYQMDEKMDHGPIFAQRTVQISETLMYPEAELELAATSGILLAEILPDIVSKKIGPKPQDEALATFTKKFKTADGFVEEKDLTAAEQGDNTLAIAILRKINALTPEPGVWTIRNGKRMKLLRAETNARGALVLRLIQIEGERPRTL